MHNCASDGSKDLVVESHSQARIEAVDVLAFHCPLYSLLWRKWTLHVTFETLLVWQ